MAGLSLQYPLGTISFFIVYLLSHFCTGHSQLIGSPQPIVAKVGDDVILTCHLQPAVDVAAKTIEWARPDLDPRFVYVWRAGQELHPPKNPSYKERTTLFTEELKHGNISLKLSKVKPSDEGRYKCYIPDMNTDASVELVVGAVSSPVISLAGIDRDKGGVVLQCESAGWFPEPEVFWLDGEGNLLSAGPTETVRGPDDLYTVSSRVTVEKRHSNSFTCRVQQKDINQTRETHIQVPDDFFEVQSSSLSTIIGLAVSLAACILLMSAAIVFFVYKRRQNTVKTKTSCCDEIDEEGRNNAKGEQQQLMTDQNREGEKIKHVVHDENQTDEIVNQVDAQNEDTVGENSQTERNQAAPAKSWYLFPRCLFRNNKRPQEEQQRRGETDKLEDNKQAADTEGRKSSDELKEANPELENKKADISQLKRHVDSLPADVQRLSEEKNQIELETKTKEIEKLQEETRSKKPEKEVKKKKGILSMKTRGKKAEKDVKKPKKQGPECDSPQFQQQDDTDSASPQDMSAGHVIEVDVDKSRIFIRLRNMSSEDQELGGWMLKVQINNKEPILYTFEKSFKLSPGKPLTMWVQGFGSHFPPTDLKWKDLKSWSPGDKLQVFLIKEVYSVH
ncbi:butyrophilin-like protein 9 isoform X2 [Micropterus salmoides]|uniref:butyrophilin-like protein 9 isoform X2 n=1 Tax=Micropterus salmoides TaxID=27706 RepID=UPI0018EC2C6B|nr:butyrophilin-like protein 9 isoform X2 [Micropterus salmoides]